MKNLFFLFACLLPLTLLAQSQEGEVVYKETIQFDLDIPEGHEEMFANIPRSQSVERILYFTPESSLYVDAPESSSQDGGGSWTSDEGNATIEIKVVRPDNRLFKDLKENKKIEQRDLFGKTFLIKDAVDTHAWKLTGNQKKVLEYVCQEARLDRDEGTVIAWFSPQIPIQNGPGHYGNLPGLILELDINEGERVVSALKVDFKELDPELIIAPKKGKEVSQAEFDAIEEKKMKEMEEEMGGRGMQIRIGN